MLNRLNLNRLNLHSRRAGGLFVPAVLDFLIQPYSAPRDAEALFPSPPTFSTSGDIPSSGTYPLQSPSQSVPTTAQQDVFFRNFGGFNIPNASGYQRLYSAVSDPAVYVSPTDTSAAGWTASASGVGVDTNASRIVFQCSKISGSVQKFRLWIRDKDADVEGFVSLTPLEQAAGSNVCYVEVVFAGSANRYLELESEGAWGIRRVYTPAGASVAAPIVGPERGTITGDSFIDGPTSANYAAGVKHDGLAWLYRARTGLLDLRLAGLPGTGYYSRNPAGRLNAQTDPERVSDMLNCSPDGTPRSAWRPQFLINWVSGINDKTNSNGGGTPYTAAQMADAAVAVVNSIRTHPSGRGVRLPLFWTGVIPRKADAATTGKTFADAQEAEEAIFAALAALNDPYLVTMPTSTDPVPWLGPDNWDADVTDGTHPNSRAANLYLADRLADAVSVAAQAMKSAFLDDEDWPPGSTRFDSTAITFDSTLLTFDKAA